MNEHSGYTLERGGHALMLLHDFGQTAESLRPLAEALAGQGLTVCVPALYDPDAHWSEWLRAARAAYTGLLNAHVRVSLCALGESAALALLLAEAYAAGQVLLVQPEQPARHGACFGLRALERQARRSLFALEGQPQILLREGADAVALRQARRLSHQIGSCLIGQFPQGGLAGALLARLPA